MRSRRLAITVGVIMAVSADYVSARPVGHEAPALSPSDVPALLKQLEEATPSRRSFALASLRRVRPFEAARPAIGQVLALLAHDQDVQVRREAAATLGGFGAEPKVLGGLSGALQDPSPEVQRAAIVALPLDVAALRLTIQLTDGGGSSREAVQRALRAIAPQDPRVVAALAER